MAANHLPHSGSVPEEKKAKARKFFSPYQTIFTTNYDLLAYWVTMSDVPKIMFGDGFREDMDNPDAPYVVFSERLGRKRGLLYLHGALHLHLAGGELRKHCWSRTFKPLTELIKEGLDANRYPLFVAEGSAQQKLEQIQRVGYLWYCLNKLSRIQSPLVVYGHSLASSDQHIVDVLSQNLDLPVIYVGVHGGSQSSAARSLWETAQRMIAERKSLVARRSEGTELNVEFFDSASASVWH